MGVTAIGLAALAVVLLWPAPWLLARAGWVSAEPRAALVLWQAMGLTAGLAMVGAGIAVGLAPVGDTLPAALASRWRAALDGEPLIGLRAGHVVLLSLAVGFGGWLLGMTGRSAWRAWRARAHQRELVDLVSMPWPPRMVPVRATASTARVIDHPAAAAYCLPGQRSRVVVTTGAVALLDPAELDAVLAHEHAHLAERHDLVVLPFAAWAAALPWLAGPERARAAVQRLVEMVADDRACVGRDRHVLAVALARVGAASAPAGALGSSDHALLLRVRRLLDPPRRSRLARGLAVGAAFALLALPTAALLLPALS